MDYFFIALLLQISSVVLTMDPLLETDNEEFIAYEGDAELLLPCVGMHLDASFLLRNAVRWSKKKDDEWIVITSNYDVMAPFSSTNRFQLQVSDDLLEWTLRITNVEARDAGIYQCQLRGAAARAVEHTVDVPMPTEEVTLTAADMAPALDDSVEFNYDEAQIVPYKLQCSVVGGNPRPEVKVMLGERDITSEFAHSNHDEVTNDFESPGLERTEFRTTLENDNFRPERNDNNRNLKCTATNTIDPALTQEDELKIYVTYAPTFDCESQVLATVGQSELSISCLVHSNPQLQPWDIWWSYTLKNGTVVHQADFDSSEFTFDSEVFDGHLQATLHLLHVNESDFRSYTLMASNGIQEEREHVVQVVTEYRSEPKIPPGGVDVKNQESTQDGDNNLTSMTTYCLSLVFTTLLAALVL